jgi:hypothetical protein
VAVNLEKWVRQEIDNERLGDFRIMASARALADLDALVSFERLKWERRQRDLIRTGVPLNMPEGTYGGLIAYPNAQTITTTSINGTANLWANLIYTPIPQNSVLAPQIYRLMVAAKVTTSTSPGNFGLNPLINSSGTWTTGGTAVSGGSTLGATGNIALTASITNAFYYLLGDLTIRNAGTSSVIVAMFHLNSTQNTAAGLAGPAAATAAYSLLFGGTAVTVDTQTTAQSLQVGAVHTVATITHNVEQLHWMDWN